MIKSQLHGSSGRVIDLLVTGSSHRVTDGISRGVKHRREITKVDLQSVGINFGSGYLRQQGKRGERLQGLWFKLDFCVDDKGQLL